MPQQLPSMDRDKECPFSAVNNAGRVWRKLRESDARSVAMWFSDARLKSKN